ncbi:MAG: helix-turn-helix transcriptional regulator [Clostridia bacterium]|nr:helix-turn-helix transcriptional regulator [Clostridia bacterium]
MNNIGDIIRKYRTNKNLTQEDLGKILFVTKQTISKWENGRSLPDLETTKKLIETLEIDPNEILGGTVQEVKKTRRLLSVAIVCGSILALFLCTFLGVRYFEKAVIESGYRDEENSANEYAINVSMVQLLATPEKYDGKLVRVIGVGNLEFEDDSLSLNKEDYEHGTGSSIWLELGEKAISYKEAKEYNGKYVIVEGFFDKDDRGHFGMFCGSIKDINRYDLWEREKVD